MSQAITTRYIGASNTRPGRIIVTTGSGARLMVSIHAVERDRTDESHFEAAMMMVRKMKWEHMLERGHLIQGWLKDGYVHVFTA